MIKIDMLNNVCTLEPQGALAKEDFAAISAQVDPIIENEGQLDGLIIKTREFPGWEGFSDMLEHFRFVKNHHQKIRKVAFVTDAKIGDLVPSIASHFVKAEVKHFDYDDYEEAVAWMG